MFVIRNIYLYCLQSKAKRAGYPYTQDPFLSFSDLLSVCVLCEFIIPLISIKYYDYNMHNCNCLLFVWVWDLGETHRLTVSENMTLRKVFGPKRDVVTWE